nr:MAG TPA: hypothetical protein [Caudoviricetes sp.]
MERFVGVGEVPTLSLRQWCKWRALKTPTL